MYRSRHKPDSTLDLHASTAERKPASMLSLQRPGNTVVIQFSDDHTPYVTKEQVTSTFVRPIPSPTRKYVVILCTFAPLDPGLGH